MENLKKEFEELKLENAKLQKEIEDNYCQIKMKDRDISQLRKDNSEIFEALRQLRNEKKILLEKLNKEIKVRIEKEAELMIFKEEAEKLPF